MNRHQRRLARKLEQPVTAPLAIQAPKLSADQAFAEAERLMRAGRKTEAERLCQTAVIAYPDHPYSLMLGGISELRAGRRNEGIEKLKRAAAKPDQDADFHNNLGNALMECRLLELARDQFTRGLARRPDNPMILYNLANTFAALGDIAQAISHYERALAGDPNYVDAHINLGNLLAQHGRGDDALGHFEAAATLRPNSAEAHNNLAFLLNERKRFLEARAHLEKALAIRPDYTHARNNMGNALLAMGLASEAIEFYRTAIALDPEYVNAWNNLSNALGDKGNYEDALAAVDQALALAPQAPAVRNSRGAVLHKLGRFTESAAEFERALLLAPGYADAWVNLAAVYNDLGQCDKAVRCCDHAIALDPRHAEAYSNRGVALVALRRFDEAMESYHRALAIDPGKGDLHCNIGSALVEQGRMDEAIGYFDQAIALDPRRPKFHFCHVLTRRATEGDPRIATLESLAREQARMSPEERIDLNFALAKAYEDTGRPNESFGALLAGNALKRKSVPYVEKITLGSLDFFGRVWTQEIVDAWRGFGHATDLPIFIVGMPRSGSTLVEQIMASLPGVADRGEVSVLHEAATAAFGPLERLIPTAQMEDRGNRLADMARRYLAALGASAPGTLRVTDKTPGNFAFLAMIHLAFPNAKIIHTRRDPLDTCLSCFSSLFTSVQFSYDLGELGRYYRAYERLMEHWRAILPAGAFLDVDYENLVADFDTEARSIVDYIGLPWNDSVRTFHKTDRPIKTASAVQVRQPLYKSSVGRARKIEPLLLQPLRAALGMDAQA